MKDFSRIAAIAAVTAGAFACSKGHTSTQAAPAAAAAQPAPVAQEQHGAGKGRIKDVVTYVDGRAVGVLRYSELPPGMKARADKSWDGSMTTARFFQLYEYVQALGLDPKKVTIQIYGSHDRVAIIEGDELEKNKNRLLFDFTQELGGKPRSHWTTKGLRVPTAIDVFSALAIYVQKKAPTYVEETESMVLDGKELDDVPYANVDDKPKGTRVYVDGKMVGFVKRRQLGDNLIVGKDESNGYKFSFGRYIASFGVDLAKAKAVDFIAGDDLAYRASPKDLESDSITFGVTNHMKGKVKTILPDGKAARVSSVQVFVTKAPPAREVEPDALEEATGDDAQSAAAQEESGQTDQED